MWREDLEKVFGVQEMDSLKHSDANHGNEKQSKAINAYGMDWNPHEGNNQNHLSLLKIELFLQIKPDLPARHSLWTHLSTLQPTNYLTFFYTKKNCQRNT